MGITNDGECRTAPPAPTEGLFPSWTQALGALLVGIVISNFIGLVLYGIFMIGRRMLSAMGAA